MSYGQDLPDPSPYLHVLDFTSMIAARPLSSVRQPPAAATELNHSDAINSLPVKASGCKAHSFAGQESTVYNVFHPDKNTICHGTRFRHELPIASGRSDQVVPATKATGCKNFV
jgi:hypothetical protein